MMACSYRNTSPSPNALTFATSLADLGTDYKVRLTVNEVDEKTETTTLVLEGQDIAFEAIIEAIEQMGASMHSIDEVEVDSRLSTSE